MPSFAALGRLLTQPEGFNFNFDQRLYGYIGWEFTSNLKIGLTLVPDAGDIASVLQQYIDGAKSGKGDDMKPAFHKDATVFGYVGADLFGGPIQTLFDWNDKNGAAKELQPRIVSIDLIGSVATVRVELDNWTGYRFTDLFTLLKVDGDWKIMNKVFHLHADGATGA